MPMGHKKAPAPNRRPRFALGALQKFGNNLCAPPSSSAAAGEAHRFGWHRTLQMRQAIMMAFGLAQEYTGP